MSTVNERRLGRLYASGDYDALFHGDTALVPWPRHSRRPEPEALEAVRELLRGPVHLFDVDPLLLVATQPKLVRHHFYHYVERKGLAYEVFGRTSADPDSELNRFPVVQPDGSGRFIIRSGHHRAAAALIKGAPLRCRVVGREPFGDAVAVTPRLMVGSTADVPAITPEGLAGFNPEGVAEFGAVQIRKNSKTLVVPSLEEAQKVMSELGCDPEWAVTLLHRSFPGAHLESMPAAPARPGTRPSKYEMMASPSYCAVCGSRAIGMGPAGWTCGLHRNTPERKARFNGATGAPLTRGDRPRWWWLP